MQDPSTYLLLPPQINVNPQFPEQEQHLKCPRCDSSNTKFCYYNNYNLSQPRHFCKNCKRYWTKGGTLRNIPVGGGSRKNSKRSSSSSSKLKTLSSSSNSNSNIPTTTATSHTINQSQLPKSEGFNPQAPVIDINGGFSALFPANGQFGNLLNGLSSNGSSAIQLGEFIENRNSSSGSNPVRDTPPEFRSEDGNSEGFLGLQSGVGSGGVSSCWTDVNGWPDLAIYTPGSSFR